MSYKLRKIARIEKEITMIQGQSDYDISGIDIAIAKFFYRMKQTDAQATTNFEDMASGDYTIRQSNNSKTLVIQNQNILDNGEAIQICYVVDLTSSKYETDFEVDINTLKTRYNEAVDDIHRLWEYIKTTGIVADDLSIDLILPKLKVDQLWVRTETGYKGVSLTDAEGMIKDIIYKYSQQKIEEIKREITTHADNETQRATNEITDVKDTSIQNIKDQEKTSTNNMISEINKHTEKKKVELNDHEQLKEQELNDLHQQLSARLQELIDGAVMDKGVLPINSDWHLLDRGNYYVIDLFNSNYKNHPINIANQNEGQGIVMVGIADDGKTKIIKYYSTPKRMFFQVLTQSNIWSEWAVLGGVNGTVYEIVQNNHGFNFNAVSLDGLTSRWVIADKNTGADAVAIKIDDNRFQLLFNGQGIIPTSSRDDKGHEFIYDEYYFLSNTVNGAFQKDKPTYGLFQPLFHTRMVENKLVADVQIGDIHDLTQHIVGEESIKQYGILTEKDLESIVLRTNGEFNNILKSKVGTKVVGNIGAISNTEIGITNATSGKSIKLKDDGTAEYPSNGLTTTSKELTGAINEVSQNLKDTSKELTGAINEVSPFPNYKGIYNEDTSYAIGDVVKVTGHEPCYVFETTLCEMSDPQHPKYFRKVYRIEDTMYYVKEKDGFEILFTKEEKIPFYTIPQKGEQQNYKSTVDDYFPYSDIRGVVFQGFASLTIAQILDKNDATKQSNGSPSNLTTLGNVMNEYPKFYCQVKMTPQGRRYRIFSYKNPTKKIAMGIKPHPVFKKPDGSYKNFEYLSRYEGSHDGTKVVSLSGKSPYVSITQGTFRDKCRNGRNANWNMLTFEQISMLQCLYIVEFGDLNSQAVLGQGRANTTSASVTGTCDALGMRSGRISNDDANGNVCYRGLEDFYANIWDFIDGFMITDRGYHYTNDPSKFGNLSAMTLFPKTLNFKITNGYVDKMEVIDGYEHLLIPYGTTGSATTYYCDNFWSHDVGEENIALFGGVWVDGAAYGCFCLNCSNVASDSGAAVGGRLSVFV